MVLRTNLAASSSEVSGFDTNGYATADWPSTNVTIGGTDSGWITAIIEIKAQGLVINNFQFPSAVSAGILSVTEKIK